MKCGKCCREVREATVQTEFGHARRYPEPGHQTKKIRPRPHLDIPRFNVALRVNSSCLFPTQVRDLYGTNRAGSPVKFHKLNIVAT